MAAWRSFDGQKIGRGVGNIEGLSRKPLMTGRTLCHKDRHDSKQRPYRHPSPDPAQAHADARARMFDQELSRAHERDRDAAVLRSHARSAARDGGYRDATSAD